MLVKRLSLASNHFLVAQLNRVAGYRRGNFISFIHPSTISCFRENFRKTLLFLSAQYKIGGKTKKNP